MSHTVVGMFDNASDAKKAVDQLLANGFSPADVDNSTSSSSMSRENESSSSSSLGSTSGDLGTGMGTGSSTGFGTGIGSGTGLGTGIGSDLGMGTGSGTGLSGTGLGSGSGTGYGSDLGAGTGTGIGSGIGRFFKNLFGDNDDQVNKYSGVGQNASSIVTVYAQSDAQAERAADILDDNGAFDVDERAMQYGYGSDRTTGTASTDTSSMEGAQSIPIIEEQLEVGKRTVQTGGARLRSRIIERPVEESVRLREERVTVERTPVDRVASSKDFDTFKEGTIELTESAEVPVVSKTARVVEEVSLDKEVTQREETISDTVRKTEVDVENIEKTGRESQTGYTKNSSSSTDL